MSVHVSQIRFRMSRLRQKYPTVVNDEALRAMNVAADNGSVPELRQVY